MPGVQLLSGHEVVVAGEARRLAALSAEGAHHAHAAERFGGVGVDVLSRSAGVTVQRANPTDPSSMREIDSGEQDDRSQQQPPINHREDDEAARELDQRPPGVVEHAEDQVSHGARIFAQQTDHPARLQLIHAVQGQSHSVRKNTSADPGLYPLGGLGRLPSTPSANTDRQQRDHNDRDRDGCQQLGAIRRHAQRVIKNGRKRLRGQDVVHDDLRRGRRREVQQRGNRQRAQGRGDPRAVALQQAEKLFEQL